MNSLPQNYITELSLAEIAIIATSRFQQLRAMDPDQPARTELAAAGVAEHRIRALYPFHFSNIAPKVIAVISESNPHLLAIDVTELAVHTAAGQRLLAQLPSNVKDSLQTRSLQAGAARSELEGCIRTILYPDPGTDLSHRSMLIGRVFRNSLCFMDHIDKLAESAQQDMDDTRRSVYEMFLHATDLLLPTMREEEVVRANLGRGHVIHGGAVKY